MPIHAQVDAAAALSTVASDLREEAANAEAAVERAARACAEFEGEGGAWAVRTAEQLKEREHEFKMVANKCAPPNRMPLEACLPMPPRCVLHLS